tara:strand:- start:1425 stop:2234 length:810 start_codon:yes stop_codon:yes gene_type:complete
MKVETHCKGCVFAEYRNKKQTGCKLNRVELLNPEKTGKTENGKFEFIFDRFCNTYRPKEWKKVLSKEEKKNLRQTVLREVFPRLGMFIFLDPSSTNAMEDLEYTIKQIKGQTRGAPRYVVVINPSVEYNEEIQTLLATEFDFEETEYHIVLSLVGQMDLFLIGEAFRHAKNGWIFVTTSGEDIPENLFEKIDDRMNIDMKRLVLVKPYEKMNGMIFQAAVYKFLDGNKSLVDTKTREKVRINFIEKVEAMDFNDPNSICEWEEFINGIA